MFTWWKLYNSVPYESVVKRLSVDTKGSRPEFCGDEEERRTEESLRPDKQETSHGS